MASQVDICNMALAHCQANKLISDFDSDTGKEADLCRRYYDTALQECLEFGNWGFAKSEAQLAVAAGETRQEWDVVYAWPANQLKLRYIVNPSSPEFPPPYEVQLKSDFTAKVICTNEEDAYAVFTKNVTTTTLFSGAFTQAFALNLGQWMCGPLTDDWGRTQQLLQRFMLQIGKALQLDTMQNNARDQEKMPNAAWITSRGFTG